MRIFSTNLSCGQLKVAYNATKFTDIHSMNDADFKESWEGLILDRGTPPPPADFVMVAKKATGGGGHEHSFFINRKFATVENVAELLRGSEAGIISVLSPQKIQIKSYRIGSWIGKGGVWARAIKSVGISVEYVALEAVSGWEYCGELQKHLPKPLLTSGPGGTMGAYYFEKEVVDRARMHVAEAPEKK